MQKRSVLFLGFFILFLSLVYANGASETGLFYYPRNVVNNSNVIIDLSDQENEIGLSNTDFGIDFSNFDEKHLAIFRIEENITDYNNDQADHNGIKVTIESLDNWVFVHETNTTSTREFSLDVFQIKRKRTDVWDRYGINNSPTFDTAEGDPICTLIAELSSDSYFYCSYSGFDAPKIKLYCTNIYDYDVSLRLKEETGYLESGFYTTRLKVTISGFKKHEAELGWGGAYLTDNGSEDSVIYNITLRGHVGDYETENTTYNFIVNSANDTYNMDLNKTVQETSSSPFQVARVQFVYSLGSKSSATANAESKFKVYISPTRDYRATYTSGTNPYYFIGRGTEYIERTDANTVYYSLCDSTGASFSVASEITGTDRWGNNTTSTISNTTYQLVPVYDSGYTTANKKYNESWVLDKYVYLKIAKDAVHDSGVYTTNIYFTLVVND